MGVTNHVLNGMILQAVACTLQPRCAGRCRSSLHLLPMKLVKTSGKTRPARDGAKNKACRNGGEISTIALAHCGKKSMTEIFHPELCMVSKIFNKNLGYQNLQQNQQNLQQKFQTGFWGYQNKTSEKKVARIFTGQSCRASCQSEASEQEPQEPLKVGCLVLGRVVKNPYPPQNSPWTLWTTTFYN